MSAHPGAADAALPAQTVARSIRIDAPVELVWAAVRDFGGHGAWMPGAGAGAEHLSWSGDANTPGTVRRFAAPGRPAFAERLNRIDDEAHELAYSIIESPFPMQRHEATIAVVADGDAAVTSWTARFEADDATAAMLDGFMGTQAFAPGLTGLKNYAEEASR